MSKQFPNLPGVNMNVKDGQLLLTSDRTSNSLLIIAEAKTNKVVPEGPVYISSEEQLRENFGGFFHRGELNPIAAQWYVARRQGLNNVYLMALKGATQKDKFVDLHDKLFNLMEDLSLSHIVLDGFYADEEVEGLTASDFNVASFEEIDTVPADYIFRATAAPEEVTSKPAVLNIKTAGADVDITLPVGAISLPKLQTDIREAFSTENIDIRVDVTEDSTKAVLAFSSTVIISGAEALTALSLTEIDAKLEGIGNPAILLSNYAERVSSEIGNTIAYIGVKPATSIDLPGIKAHVDALVKRENAVSPYLQIVAGPQVGVTIPGNLRTQWLSGVIQYAILVSGLAPQIAPTNQVLPGITGLRYNLSSRQLNDLTGNKYVTFRLKSGQVRVVDGVTSAPDLSVGQDTVKSDFTRLSTLRIVNYMVNEVRNACDVFIGMPNEFANYNSMNTAVKSVIHNAIEFGIIQDARYSIRLGEQLDTSEIELVILPQFELRTINVTVGLSTPDNF